MSSHATLLLVNAPPWRDPPIAIYTLKDYFEQYSISTDCLDLNIKLYNMLHNFYGEYWDMQNFKKWLFSEDNTFDPELYSLIQSTCDSYAQQIASASYEYIGFSLASPKEFISFELIALIKKYAPEKKILLGGSTCCTKDGLELISSLEKTMLKRYSLDGPLIEGIFSGNAEFEIKEYLLNPTKYKWGFIEYAKNKPFDETSFPKYSKKDLVSYNPYIRDLTLTIEWSRGCINNCNFCNIKQFNGSFISKPPELRIKELEYHYNHYLISSFTICDSVVNGHLPHLRETCKQIIKKKLPIRWSGQFMARSEMTQEDYYLLKKSGCEKVEFGVESFSNPVLLAMNKNITSADIKKNIHFAKKAGIAVYIYLIIGYPGETESAFEETCQFLRENADYIEEIRSVRQLYLLSGSFVSDNKKDYNIEVKSDDYHNYYWHISDENTYKIRMNRVNKIITLANEVGITISLHDE